MSTSTHSKKLLLFIELRKGTLFRFYGHCSCANVDHPQILEPERASRERKDKMLFTRPDSSFKVEIEEMFEELRY